MNNISFIFTIRIDSKDRYTNLIAILRYYTRCAPEAEFILLEADESPKLDQLISKEFPMVSYIFVQDDNPVFHRTHYINEEFKLAKYEFAAIIDSDIIVPESQLEQAVSILNKNDSVVMVSPYDGRCIGVDDYFSDLFRTYGKISVLDNNEGNRYLMFGYKSVGGAFLVNVRKYKTLGWENEYFLGWGPEDFEREHRLNILGYRPVRVGGPIYHLSHPRGINSSNAHKPLVLNTKKEYCHVCSMLPDELREYIKSWPWIN